MRRESAGGAYDRGDTFPLEGRGGGGGAAGGGAAAFRSAARGCPDRRRQRDQFTPGAWTRPRVAGTTAEVGTEPRAPAGVSAAGSPIEVSGRYLGAMHLERLTRVSTPLVGRDSETYLRGNRGINGLWSDGATLWVADAFSNQARFRKKDGDGSVELGPKVPTGSQFRGDEGELVYGDGIAALTAYDLRAGYRIPGSDLANTSYYVYHDTTEALNPGGGAARDGLVKPEGVWVLTARRCGCPTSAGWSRPTG